MLKYDYKKSLIANIKSCMSWINFILPDSASSRKALEQAQEDTDAALCEVAEMTANNEVNIEDLAQAVLELAALIGG